MTYTVVEMEVSKATFDEVHAKLKDAGYDHAIDSEKYGDHIIPVFLDMTHIALVLEKSERK